MQVTPLNIDRNKARELWKTYKSHRAYQKPEDYEIMRTYQLIAQGRVVIQAIESIRQAGIGEDGFPKLALMQATARRCEVLYEQNGSVRFCEDQSNYRSRRKNIYMPAESLPRFSGDSWLRRRASCLLPIIPVHLRPKRGLENYHILWEAEWKKLPPGDPYLLRQIGKGDMWLVVAAWDLTDVEKAAMRTRINAAG